jgi:hypothetical protein
MPMKDGLKTAADETGDVPMEGSWRLLPMEQGLCRWNRDCADKKEVDENTIVTEADYGIR